MNALRSEIFLESEQELIKQIDQSIFYLNAPTGGGKTNTSIHLALETLKKDRDIRNIFYIFPFNTLIEQTKETFENIFEKEKDFICVNSTDAITQKQEEDLNYEKLYLDYQFMHYPIVLTSHVRFFQTLFGTTRESALLLNRLANSVIILDEIQCYKNRIWKSMIMFLEKFAKYFHIKIIIMSATLPQLDCLIEDKTEKFVELLPDKQNYFTNPIFQNRVRIDFSLLKEKMNLEYLANFVQRLGKENKKILVEFITKTAAREFYQMLKEKMPEKEIIEISGDDNKYYRKKQLSKIKQATDIIVVCTQVIEAGVDIDMDIGLKDISLLESEEQFIRKN